jgi:hypothetical protein
MKIYKNNKVKHWSPCFDDLKSFDILDIKDISLRYDKAYEFIRNADYDDYRLQYGAMRWADPIKDNASMIVKRHSNDFKNSKFIYIELPYQLFEDYFNTWLYRNPDHGPTPKPWSEIEKHIDKNEEWGKEIEAFKHGFVDEKGKWNGKTVREYEDVTSYGIWLTYLLYGLGTPVFNNGNYFPKRNSHRMAFCYKNKSDVPFFYPIQDNSNFNLEFIPFSLNPEVSGYDHEDFKPGAELEYYFKDIKKAEVSIENKEITFYNKDNNSIAKYIK